MFAVIRIRCIEVLFHLSYYYGGGGGGGEEGRRISFGIPRSSLLIEKIVIPRSLVPLNNIMKPGVFITSSFILPDRKQKLRGLDFFLLIL